MGRLDGKTFVLGVGAQKAGTSWLYNYLLGHPRVFMSPLKELHFFNAIWRPDIETREKTRERVLRMLDQCTAAIHATAPDIDAKAAEQLRMLLDRYTVADRDDARYMELFAGRIGAHHTHFGEITPAYALLPADAYRRIAALHPRIKVLFLMRDPIERIRSGLSMSLRLGQIAPEAVAGGMELDRITLRRSRYEITLSNLRSAFTPDQLHVCFYEALFTREAIEGICAFLEIDCVEPDFALRVNDGGPKLKFGQETVAALRSLLDPTYRFCRAEFGDRVPAAWSR